MNRRSSARVVATAFALLLLARIPNASPADLDARVVWIRGTQLYVAAPDSIPVEPGDRLTLMVHGKTIATAQVSAVPDRALAIATLISGTPPHRKLDRIRIRAEHPPQHATPRLRVGIPSATRACLLFACDRVTVQAPPGLYLAESFSDRSTRLVRDSAEVARAPWPDTLVVRQFDEAGDEEIALERGEIDAAVFWPGELSAHMRQQPRWQGFLLGTRSRGVVAAWWKGSGERTTRGLEPSRFASLNQNLFRGDLGPCRAPGSGADLSPSPDSAVRFAVDPACPGHAEMERLLNRGDSSPAVDPGPRAWVTLLDFPGAAPDSVRGRVACLFTLRCPIVSDVALRPYLDALGSSALADLMECAAARHQP